ncbi:unnamed protein product [Vitrella brassicaformis CCMP3155]|uniref:Uncharacterized protein n=1 Tax=Vitrella brassicaformis (strain CCMP3155) TaxID=1169540 RepID=A0A0G4EMU3_VITBC|nr:unnamed protein product [Vitrella brassicaformis CCMP3155]|eukprot:CEL99147.1 unnamed protein product [Vitrella brassicaformis CCMP3155]
MNLNQHVSYSVEAYIASLWEEHAIPRWHRRLYAEQEGHERALMVLIKEAECLRSGNAPVQRVMRSVDYREFCLRRLELLNEAYANRAIDEWHAQSELRDVLLELRLSTLEVVEAIDVWRKCLRPGRKSPLAVPWLVEQNSIQAQHGDDLRPQNYLLKMTRDTSWLPSSALSRLMMFSAKSDPFFVTSSAPGTLSAAVTPSSATQHQRQKTTRDTSRPATRAAPSQAASRPTGGPRVSRTAQSWQQRPAALPLQPSLLSRIHAAESIMLLERAREKLSGGAGSRQSARERPRSVLTFSTKLEAVPSPEPVPASAEPTEAPIEAGTPLSLLPIECTTSEIADIFRHYLEHVDASLANSLPPLGEWGPATAKHGGQFFWLTTAGTGERGKKRRIVGLAVFRNEKTLSVVCKVYHLSVANTAMLLDHDHHLHSTRTEVMWPEVLSDAAATVRQYILQKHDVSSIRVTLVCQDLPSGEYKVDPAVEGAFKSAGFKWYQMTNVAGGRRVVMNTTRRDDDLLEDTVAAAGSGGDDDTPTALSLCVCTSVVHVEQGECRALLDSPHAMSLSSPLVAHEGIKRFTKQHPASQQLTLMLRLSRLHHPEVASMVETGPLQPEPSSDDETAAMGGVFHHGREGVTVKLCVSVSRWGSPASEHVGSSMRLHARMSAFQDTNVFFVETRNDEIVLAIAKAADTEAEETPSPLSAYEHYKSVIKGAAAEMDHDHSEDCEVILPCTAFTAHCVVASSDGGEGGSVGVLEQVTGRLDFGSRLEGALSMPHFRDAGHVHRLVGGRVVVGVCHSEVGLGLPLMVLTL